jgi:hypothetical protein
MSEIKVNKISPKQTCTQLTLGDSGDTIIVTSGANFNTDAIKNLNTSSIITQTNATTITLGYSGSTIAIASGATQTGFGRTGSVNWDTTKKTSGFTAVNGVGYFCDTSSVAFTVTLPATPSAGDIIGIRDYSQTFATNNLTVGRNSQPIDGLSVDLVLSTNGIAITLVYVDATQGWKSINSNEIFNEEKFVAATGGCIATSGDYKIHTFTGPGTFTVTCAGNPGGSSTVDYLVIAGGGGGGTYQGGVSYGGGAGAGGYRESVPSPAAWTASPLANPGGALPVSVQGYPITVGGGGGGGSSGSNSVFSTITSAGGGYGYGVGVSPGGPGGSGGGGNGTGNTPPVSPPQGNNGGGASGGGAGEVGDTDGVGDAGDGVASSINGSPVTRGGGGGANNGPNEGSGGDGGGGSPRGGSGGANTGGGGGAGGYEGAPGTIGGGSGGSGIIIIRYKFQ